MLGPVVKDWLSSLFVGKGDTKFFDIIPYDLLAMIGGHAIVFLVFTIALSIISQMLTSLVRQVGLGMVDRTLGIFFGLARGIIIAAILFLPINVGFSQELREKWFENSQSVPYVEWVSNKILALTPFKPAKEKEADQSVPEVVLPESKTPSEKDQGYKAQDRKELDALMNIIKEKGL
jgi:membrane protein required for colicin V production